MFGGGKAYNVYVYSYLGYGLMQGRSEVLATAGSGTCVNEGTTGSFKSPGGEEVPLESAPGGSDAARCGDAVRSALRLREDCGEVKEQCTFAGAWGGTASHAGREFYVMSYFFDRCAPSPDKACVHLASRPRGSAPRHGPGGGTHAALPRGADARRAAGARAGGCRSVVCMHAGRLTRGSSWTRTRSRRS